MENFANLLVTAIKGEFFWVIYYASNHPWGPKMTSETSPRISILSRSNECRQNTSIVVHCKFATERFHLNWLPVLWMPVRYLNGSRIFNKSRQKLQPYKKKKINKTFIPYMINQNQY